MRSDFVWGGGGGVVDLGLIQAILYAKDRLYLVQNQYLVFRNGYFQNWFQSRVVSSCSNLVVYIFFYIYISS